MIITGNSNVDCLAKGNPHFVDSEEPVSVKWVGALKIEHFYNNHPAALKVNELFISELGWKFLSIGTHDIYTVCHWASLGKLDEALVKFTDLYFPLFKQFHDLGKFAWIVFPQPTEEISFQNLSGSDVLSIANQFNTKLQHWALESGIAVINPLKMILGTNGLPLPDLLQVDNLHLNEKGAQFYWDEINLLLGESIITSTKPIYFEPKSELESFCSLLLNSLGLPWQKVPSRARLQNDLLAYIVILLKERGIDVDITIDTDLVDSGFLDSLGLVDVYTRASGVFPMDIPFDVDLRELNNVARICDSLFVKFNFQFSNIGRFSVGTSDFLKSLRAGFINSEQRQEVFEAEMAISKMDSVLLKVMTENIWLAGEGLQCPYGVPLLWLALGNAEQGNFAEALALLARASNPEIGFPLRDERVAYYRDIWARSHLKVTSSSTKYIWDAPVELSVLVIGSPMH